MSRQAELKYRGKTAREIGMMMDRIQKNMTRLSAIVDEWSTNELIATEDVEMNLPTEAPRKRGRPCKVVEATEEAAPKRRGRPRKVVAEAAPVEAPRKRGRPRKNV